MVKTRRWDDPPEAEEGLTILVARYRPRGLPKEGETWDLWIPELGPSPALHAAFYGKHGLPLSWEVYRASYLREMRGGTQQKLIAELAQRVRAGQTLTLLCSSACQRESRCHRSLLRELILAKVATGDETSPSR